MHTWSAEKPWHAFRIVPGSLVSVAVYSTLARLEFRRRCARMVRVDKFYCFGQSCFSFELSLEFLQVLLSWAVLFQF